MSSEIARLVARCKGDVTLTVNDHRGIYQTAAAHIAEAKDVGYAPETDDPAIEAKMIERRAAAATDEAVVAAEGLEALLRLAA